MFKIESGIFLLCVIILLFPALYNGFPIVTSDTGSYIEDAFKLYVPSDRSIGYGIFIRLTSLTFSLWYVLFAQAIVLTFFLRLLVRHFCKNVNYNYLLPAVVLLITVCTSAAWFCSQIMADIFTAILLLAICVLYFVPISRKWQTYLLLFFIWFFIILHNSHLLIVLILSLLLAAFYTYKRNKVFLRKSLMLFSMSVMGFLFLSTLNFISGKGFRPSQSTHVFLMCRMVENGIMDQFLADKCPTENYKLCAYQGKLPNRQWDFMWNPESPLYKTGGWEANEEEYTKIIRETLTQPYYIRLHLFKSFEATLRQLPLINIGDGNFPLLEDSSPYSRINYYFHHEIKEYVSSLQNLGILKSDFFNAVILLFTFISICTTLFVQTFPAKLSAIPTQWKDLFGIVITFIICNAFVTATFSTVLGRFNSRVFWVLPFFCILYLVNFFRRRYNTT